MYGLADEAPGASIVSGSASPRRTTARAKAGLEISQAPEPGAAW